MAQELPSSLDNLKNSRSLIDLDAHSTGDFGLDQYTLTGLLEDIVLVEFIDEVNDSAGDAILRGGIYVPVNAQTSAWRKGRVLLAGPTTRSCKVGDLVVFPNDKGASVANIDVAGHGTLKKGMFLNEQRIFGICKPTVNESQPSLS